MARLIGLVAGVGRPFLGEGLHLPENKLSRAWLSIRRVAVPGEQPLDGGADLRPDVISRHPVGGDVAAEHADQVAGDVGEHAVAHLGHGGLVLRDRVVEGELVAAQRMG